MSPPKKKKVIFPNSPVILHFFLNVDRNFQEPAKKSTKAASNVTMALFFSCTKLAKPFFMICVNKGNGRGSQNESEAEQETRLG